MGAYENPKSYITDYSAGVKAFTSTFNQGIKAGVQMGRTINCRERSLRRLRV